MIKSFKDQRTAALFKGVFIKGIPDDIRKRAALKLLKIDLATSLNDLMAPTANRLEALKGNMLGLHSIRVNQQWRIVFEWSGMDAYDVFFVDYH